MNGLVIPCYNEELRLKAAEIEALIAGQPDLHVCLVNDGSTDHTARVLSDLAARLPRVTVLDLDRNRGKAEAVRRGLIHLIARGFTWVGYADADFSTPAAELLRLYALTKDTPARVLMGSRVKLLGRDIDRRMVRHYLGRVFATLASMALDLAVYDTQCGAKAFAATDDLTASLNEPFRSRWAFDVELIGRLNLRRPHALHQTFCEVPLLIWRDVGGSKLGPLAMLKAGFDLLKIGARLRRARRESARTKTASAPR